VGHVVELVGSSWVTCSSRGTVAVSRYVRREVGLIIELPGSPCSSACSPAAEDALRRRLRRCHPGSGVGRPLTLGDWNDGLTDSRALLFARPPLVVTGDHHAYEEPGCCIGRCCGLFRVWPITVDDAVPAATGRGRFGMVGADTGWAAGMCSESHGVP